MVIQMYRGVASDIVRHLKRSSLTSASAVEFIAALEEAVNAPGAFFGTSVTINISGGEMPPPDDRDDEQLRFETETSPIGLEDDAEALASAGMVEEP